MVFETKVGDTGEPLEGTVKDQDGAVDLSGAVVYLWAKRRDTGDVVITESEMTVTDEANGKVEYTFSEDEIDEAMTLDYEVVARWSDGERTFPDEGFNEIKINTDIEGS